MPAILRRFTHHPTVGDGVLDVPARRRTWVVQPWAVADLLGRFLLYLPKESVPDPERKRALVRTCTQGCLVARLGGDLQVVIPKL